MKNVIITGGASGIGLATAKKLSKDNKVIIVDYKDINEDFIQNNFNYYKNVYFYKSKREDILNLKQYVLDNFEKLDYLVCCAGILSLPCEIDTITDENIDRTIDVNLKGTFKKQDVIETIDDPNKVGEKLASGKCVFLGKNGCKLSDTERPYGGLQLEPNIRGIKYCKLHFSIIDAALEWLEFHEELDKIFEK